MWDIVMIIVVVVFFIVEIKVILEEEKRRLEYLQKQLEGTEYAQSQLSEYEYEKEDCKCLSFKILSILSLYCIFKNLQYFLSTWNHVITPQPKKNKNVRVGKNCQHISPLNVRSFLLLFFNSHDSHQPNERVENAAGWWASPDNTNKPSHRWVLLRHFCCLTRAEKQLVVDWVMHWHKSCF